MRIHARQNGQEESRIHDRRNEASQESSVRCQAQAQEEGQVMAKKGLYANINAKKKRIAAGSGEKMRKPGTKGAPTAKAFRDSKRSAKKK